MKSIDWTDLAYFATVARRGSLGSATLHLGVSQATLSRRLRKLESDTGRRFFLHGGQGYALTAEGRDLLSRLTPMEEAASAITAWDQAGRGPVLIQISADTWTALHFAERLSELWQPGDIWLSDFVMGEDILDIARREIDIGLLKRPPDPTLAGRAPHRSHAVCGLRRGPRGYRLDRPSNRIAHHPLGPLDRNPSRRSDHHPLVAFQMAAPASAALSSRCLSAKASRNSTNSATRSRISKANNGSPPITKPATIPQSAPPSRLWRGSSQLMQPRPKPARTTPNAL